MFQPLVQRVRQAQQDHSFHFAPLLPEKAIREAFGDASELEREGTVYSLPVVVWMFLAQVLCADHSCRPTVGRLIAWLVGQGRRACSAETGTYFTARGRLSESGCHQLLTKIQRGQASLFSWGDGLDLGFSDFGSSIDATTTTS